MTINLKPETERLVQEELQNGHFRSVDEMIVQSVQSRREGRPLSPEVKRKAAKKRSRIFANCARATDCRMEFRSRISLTKGGFDCVGSR